MVRDKINKEEIPRCECGALVKPDIVFFGEVGAVSSLSTPFPLPSDDGARALSHTQCTQNLPDRFAQCVTQDFRKVLLHVLFVYLCHDGCGRPTC
jgi:hypothetical protein